MNRSIDILKQIYKPYRYTYKGSALILESTSGNFVVKERTTDLNKLFNYLKSRSFDSFPKIIDNSRKNVEVFEYIDDTNYPKEQRAEDLINIVASLHNKTSYYKDVTEDNYKQIYEDIKNNLDYYSYTYEKYFDEFFKDIYLSPSKYLFMRNYSKIISNINFCKRQLDNWYDLVKDSKKSRVSVIHNDLELDHFLKNDKGYLISWDKYTVDTPILDLVSFYKKEYLNLNFENLFKKYLNSFNLNDDELKLLLILISLPPEIKFEKNEFNSCIDLRKQLDYIYKTENLIRPYYSKNEKEK